MSDITYKDGLELWVWDSGELEGFAVFLDGEVLDEQNIKGLKYEISKPADTSVVEVSFGGADGGATKIVDRATKEAVAFQNSGNRHKYTIKA